VDAVQHIAWQLDRIYDRKIDAIKKFGETIKEKAIHAEPWWQTLLEFAVTTALSAISAGLASVVAKSLDGALQADGGAALKGAIVTFANVDPEKMEKVTVLTRAMIVDAAKDASKNVVKAALEAGVSAMTGSTVHSTEAIGQFVELHTTAFRTERESAHAETASLEQSLARLEVGQLNEIVQRLGQVPDEADRLVFEHATYEWENLRARSATEATDKTKDPDLNAPKHTTGEQAIAGVLEIGLDVEPDRRNLASSKLAYMVIRDGEPAAARELRAEKRPFGSIPMNRAYQFSFDRVFSDSRHVGGLMPMPGVSFVKVGVGADHGLQMTTIDAEELKLLEQYQAKQPVDTNVGAGLDLVGEHIADEGERAAEHMLGADTDPAVVTRRVVQQQRALAAQQDAFAAVRALIAHANSFTTDKLEDE
jgi:hypothetical protein